MLALVEFHVKFKKIYWLPLLLAAVHMCVMYNGLRNGDILVIHCDDLQGLDKEEKGTKRSKEKKKRKAKDSKRKMIRTNLSMMA